MSSQITRQTVVLPFYWSINITNQMTAVSHAHLYIPSLLRRSYIFLSRSKAGADGVFLIELCIHFIRLPLETRPPRMSRFVTRGRIYRPVTSATRCSAPFNIYLSFSPDFSDSDFSFPKGRSAETNALSRTLRLTL